MRTIIISNAEMKYEFHFNPLKARELIDLSEFELPQWTELPFHKCTVCPYNDDEVQHCPPAIDILCILNRFANFVSTEQLDIRYIDQGFEVKKTVDSQTALSVVIGYLIFTSACPVLNSNHFILNYVPPFTSDDQLSYHLLAAAMIKNFFLQEEKHQHLPFDLEQFKLDHFYLEDVLKNLMKRVKEASTDDGNLNAIVRLTSLNMLTNLKMEEFLENFRQIIKKKQSNPS